MKALVTGCAGFIGSHLTEALLADGDSVVGVDCFNDNYGRRAKMHNLADARDSSNFEFVPVDLSRGDLEDLVEGCDAVFHLAAEPGVRPSWGDRFDTYLRNNFLATHRLLDAIETVGRRPRLVYASSSSIYGDAEELPTREDAYPRPISPYGVTKLGGEHLCTMFRRSEGFNVAILRYFTVYGPRQRPDMAFHRFCRAALEDTEITVYGDGTQTRDFTYVADAVAATKAAATAELKSGGIYNIGGGSRASVNETLDIIGELAGRELKVNRIEVQQGDVRDTGAATERAAADLGFAPATTVAEGLAAEYAWLSDLLAAQALG